MVAPSRGADGECNGKRALAHTRGESEGHGKNLGQWQERRRGD